MTSLTQPSWTKIKITNKYDSDPGVQGYSKLLICYSGVIKFKVAHVTDEDYGPLYWFMLICPVSTSPSLRSGTDAGTYQA